MTNKEKDLTIKLLEAKIERMTGKKVVYTEKNKKKEDLMKAINEAVEAGEVDKAELEEIFGGAMQKIGQFMGTKWDQTTAEKAFNQSYAKNAAVIAQKLGTDANTIKDSLIKFMMDNGGNAILSGNGQNAQWDATSKTFKRLASQLGGPGGNVMGEGKKKNESLDPYQVAYDRGWDKGYKQGYSDSKEGKPNVSL